MNTDVKCLFVRINPSFNAQEEIFNMEYKHSKQDRKNYTDWNLDSYGDIKMLEKMFRRKR